MKEMTVKVHKVSEDGLPDMERLVGRVGVLWDGEIVSGWPLLDDDADVPEEDEEEIPWEPAEDRFGGRLYGVTHWIEFPVSLWNISMLYEDDLVWDIAMAHNG